MNTPDPIKAAEQAALAKVNAEKASVSAWATAHAGWLIAIAAGFALGFILAKLV